MNEVMERLTPTEKRIFTILLDGEKHLKNELRAAIDPLASFESMRVCIMKLRGKLPENMMILCEIKQGSIFYRLVYRFVPSLTPEMLRAINEKSSNVTK